MPPRTKYEDTVFEKPDYSGKIFMYSSVSWNVLFPIVDIVRALKKHTIVGHIYGKGQQIIKLYVPQYNHRLLGYELKNKNDYIKNLIAVKNIFIFSDESDIIATNLINTAKKNKINVICYSNIDSVYHFYNNVNGNNSKQSFKTPQEVLDIMYTLLDYEDVRKISDLFPDFEIIEPEIVNVPTNLDKCIEAIRNTELKVKTEKEKSFVKVFDKNLNKIKQMEYERSTRNMVYPDSLEIIKKTEVDKQKSLLSKFFSKK